MNRQNVTLYIDAANLIMSLRDLNLENQFDIHSVLTYLKDKYRINKCIYFTANIKTLKKDFEYLKSLGVELNFKKAYYEGGKMKANCDVEISSKITEDVLTNNVDRVILLSGDGDFVSVLDYAKEKEKRVTCVAISEFKTSKMIKQRRYLEVSFLDEFLLTLPKRKGPTGHVASAGVLFGVLSITTPQNLSTAKSIEKEYKFDDFIEAMTFVNEVAKVAEEMQHHPEIEIKYNVVEIETTTHDAGNTVTEKDIELIKRIDEIYQKNN